MGENKTEFDTMTNVINERPSSKTLKVIYVKQSYSIISSTYLLV